MVENNLSKEQYTLTLIDKGTQEDFAEIIFSFNVFTREQDVRVNVLKEGVCSELEIKKILDKPVLFTFGGRGRVESINMRTYKPGTLSHFAVVYKNFLKKQYDFKYNAPAEELRKEILTDLYGEVLD